MDLVLDVIVSNSDKYVCANADDGSSLLAFIYFRILEMHFLPCVTLYFYPGLLMEEEIPTGVYLLRMIPKQSLNSKFPRMNYGKFVCSAIVRILMGYIFLLNVFLVVVQSNEVLDIFYDVLALQFLQQLDDIAFSVAKMDVLGRTLKKATTQKCYRAEFQKQSFGRNNKITIALKAVYIINLLAALFGLTYITVRQAWGYYQCGSITITFGDDIWEDAVFKTPSGELKEMILLYSFFNGVYKIDGSHEHRPIFREQNKFDDTPFKSTVGAEIKYCKKERAWVFTHENLRKSSTSDEVSYFHVGKPRVLVVKRRLILDMRSLFFRDNQTK